MSRLISSVIVLLLSIAAVPAKAEWTTIIGHGTDSTFTVENKAFLRSGNQRQFWAISNLGKKLEMMGKTVKSAVVLHETDCVSKSLKVMYMRFHAERDGNGLIISETNMPFEANVAEAESRVIRYVCEL